MTINDLTMFRLANLQISRKKFFDVKELLNYMGAFQAQDYAMSKWAIGLRLKKSDESLINSAIDNGDILRTHLLRPTWHFVSADNIHWMLQLTASKIKKSMNSRHKELGLTREICRKSNEIMREALRDNNHLTRESLIMLLNKAKIRTDGNRASHLLAEAELSGIICSGVQEGNKITYALLEERVKYITYLTRDEYLKKLAGIFFASRGPATIKDFTWWSGLSKTDAEKSMEMMTHKINSFMLDSQTYWFIKPSPEDLNLTDRIFLLPPFDEFLISYKDRSLVIISDSHRKIISQYGMFRPIIVHDGKVIGIWKRTLKKNDLTLQMTYFNHPAKRIMNLVAIEAERFAMFTGKKIYNIEHVT